MNFVEADVIQKVKAGDGSAFTLLVEAYQRPVYNLCYRMLGNPQEAEDASQESFWRAYQAIDRYDTKRSFITWLLSITAHYCIDQQRKRKIQTFDIDLFPEGNLPDTIPNPERVVGQMEEDDRLYQLLTSLQPQDRAAIILRYWYDFSEIEIAKTLKLSQSAVKSRLFRSRRLLAQIWEKTRSQTLNTGEKYVSPAF